MPDKKETYPIMNLSNWWAIRRKFLQSLPSAGVSVNYLSSLLDISENSASNIRTTLRRLGIIDDDDMIKERAKQWRDDEQYPKVCNEIRNEIYPQELRDLFPSPTDDNREAIARWFANRTDVGLAASKMMSSFFILLSEATVKTDDELKPKSQKKRSKSTQGIKTDLNEKAQDSNITNNNSVKINNDSEINIPSININIEVHISSDATVTQIDQIFESMAKHLNIRRKNTYE